MGEADWGYHIHYPGGACGSWCDFKRDHHLDKKTYGFDHGFPQGKAT